MRRTAFALPVIALSLFSAACSPDIAAHSARPLPLQPQAAAAAASDFELIDPAMLPGSARPDRNVFTYREKPAALATPHHEHAAIVPAVVSLPASGLIVKQPEKPVFPYRCIGRFGPEGAQLVAFIVDGEVKLARAGEVLQDRYLVRGVGIESVEVGLLDAPEVSWRLEFGK
jgi:hypothetical protein